MSTQSSTVVDLVTVPAVQGRITRFPGSAMHAVPCPVDRWLLTDDEENALRCEEEYDNEDADYDDEYDTYEEAFYDADADFEEEEEEVERSVLLFNTWSDDSAPPQDVQTGFAAALSISESGPEAEEHLIEEWETEYGADAEWIRCSPVSEWSRATIEDKYSTSLELQKETNAVGDPKVQLARVNLMGEQNRRLYPERNAILIVPDKQVLKVALNQERKVTRLKFTEVR
jgi:hypothetical protein